MRPITMADGERAHARGIFYWTLIGGMLACAMFFIGFFCFRPFYWPLGATLRVKTSGCYCCFDWWAKASETRAYAA